MRRSLSLWLVLAISSSLAIGSAFSAFRELTPFLENTGSIESKFDALSAGSLQPGLSFYSKKIILDDCNYTLNSVSILMIDETIQNKIRKNCEEVASSIVSDAPTFSYAWYVKALAGKPASDPKDFETALLQSRRTAPNQGDLAYYRAVLSYYNWQYLSAPARQELAADLIVSSHSSRGREWIAQRYVEDQSFRDVIVKSMEQAPDNIQRGFLRTLKAING